MNTSGQFYRRLFRSKVVLSESRFKRTKESVQSISIELMYQICVKIFSLAVDALIYECQFLSSLTLLSKPFLLSNWPLVSIETTFNRTGHNSIPFQCPLLFNRNKCSGRLCMVPLKVLCKKCNEAATMCMSLTCLSCVSAWLHGYPCLYLNVIIMFFNFVLGVWWNKDRRWRVEASCTCWHPSYI